MTTLVDEGRCSLTHSTKIARIRRWHPTLTVYDVGWRGRVPRWLALADDNSDKDYLWPQDGEDAYEEARQLNESLNAEIVSLRQLIRSQQQGSSGTVFADNSSRGMRLAGSTAMIRTPTFCLSIWIGPRNQGNYRSGSVPEINCQCFGLVWLLGIDFFVIQYKCWLHGCIKTKVSIEAC